MADRSKNILVAGDSFAAVWPFPCKGWVNFLAEKYQVTNIAQPGVGEYKIYKQLESINVNSFDIVIVSHTSPSRIHTRCHPLHTDGFHKNCDLIYTDLESRWTFPGTKIDVAKKWFEYFYDDDYQIDIYNFLREKIFNLIKIPYISLSHISIVKELSIEPTHLDFSNVWKHHRGTSNHYDEIGNKFVFDKVDQYIGKINEK
jgi:hypothetical protein